MSRRTETIPADYFEDKYRSDIDPWRFRSSDYEREKYRSTIGALGRQRFDEALEVGCSIGVLSAQLARHCVALTAIDASSTAIAAARAAAPANVSFAVATLPQDFPPGCFDLIVLSEVLYYFSQADLLRVAQRCVEALRPEGEIIQCHWLGETDYPLTGRDASDQFATAVATRLPVRTVVRDEIYRLERLSAR
ncbi:methyltransferase domain-containing protein [Rhodopseudomonas palustris]|uniref:Nodulation protein S (NodS) n=1 Tax=Rhodopseudomonas pseudopalustris TaxID=1513892 RepID=A0A1H8W832_9BRAD|nr:methyltransferase domain-containing protein [Rhodopseudomonas palustris]SEP23780.1 Nodulation protein S (NodS) [Rhodopseudomonas pseudopalustris]